ncbi:MAG: hypothetical protein V4547_12290 [Bacteroidota bacterium]
MKNIHQIKENWNLAKMEREQKANVNKVNSLLLLEIKQDEILNRFRAKLEDIDKDIHKLISELYIPESNNKIN